MTAEGGEAGAATAHADGAATTQGGAGSAQHNRGGDGGSADQNRGGQGQERGGAGGQGGNAAVAGAGGSWASTGVVSCQADDDGIGCCRDTVSCASLPDDWCSIGAGGQGNSNPDGDTCCDDGHRQVCIVVQGETGLEAYPRQEKCECAGRQCECQLQQ